MKVTRPAGARILGLEAGGLAAQIPSALFRRSRQEIVTGAAIRGLYGRPTRLGLRERLRAASARDELTASNRTSLPFWRLPELNFVALWIHDPPEFPVLRVLGLLEHVTAFFAQRFEKSCEIFDSIVDHEGRLARSEVLAIRWTDQPGRSSLGRVAFGVSPGEGCSTPVLNVDPEVLLVPGA